MAWHSVVKNNIAGEHDLLTWHINENVACCVVEINVNKISMYFVLLTKNNKFNNVAKYQIKKPGDRCGKNGFLHGI